MQSNFIGEFRQSFENRITSRVIAISCQNLLPRSQMDRIDYTNHRRHLRETQVQEQGKYDKALLYLSCGAIGLSATAISNAPVLLQGASLTFLVISWVLFLLSISCVVGSHYLSAKVLASDLEKLDELYENDRIEWRDDPRNKTINLLNVVAFVLFIFGAIAFLATTVSLSENNMAGRDQISTNRDKGLTSLKPPKPSTSTTKPEIVTNDSSSSSEQNR